MSIDYPVDDSAGFFYFFNYLSVEFDSLGILVQFHLVNIKDLTILAVLI